MKQWVATVAVLALAACSQGGGSANSAANTTAANTAAATPTEARTGGAPAPAAATQTGTSAPNPVPDGFYRLQDVEGDWDGTIAATCYVHGNGPELLGEQISYTSDPYPCTPQVRHIAEDGNWSYTQVCNLTQGRTTYSVTGRHEPNGDWTARIVPALDSGEAPPNDHARSIRSRRIGDCPQGWRPGDWVSLTSGRGDDGVWRVHNINNHSDVGLTFEELPDYLTALLAH